MTAGLVLLRGLPGSGKTTLARALLAGASRRDGDRLVRSNRDDIRRQLAGDHYDVETHEDLVKAVQREQVRTALRAGWDVVVDDTNLPARTGRAWAELALSEGALFDVDDTCLQVPVDECVRRDALRHGPERVGEDVIRDMHRRYLARGPLPDVVPPDPADIVDHRPYVTPRVDPATVLVDVDGTVADAEGVRGPFDTTRYHLDRPRREVVDLVRLLSQNGRRIVYCSGRSEDDRAVTETWLVEHVGIPFELIMRPSGDDRSDDVVKLDLFNRHVRDSHRVCLVIDDRARVVRMWRALGLTVAQVGEGAF